MSDFFCSVFPFKSFTFDILSQNVFEFLSDVSDFSESSFPKMAKKKAFGGLGKLVSFSLSS